MFSDSVEFESCRDHESRISHKECGFFLSFQGVAAPTDATDWHSTVQTTVHKLYKEPYTGTTSLEGLTNQIVDW